MNWNFPMLFGTRLCLVAALIVLVAVRIRAAPEPALSDDEHLKNLAAQVFYSVPSQALRKRNGSVEFLFLTDASPRLNSPPIESGRVILARREGSHKFSIVWQYNLPTSGSDAVWWNQSASNDKSDILVTLYGSNALILRSADSIPVLQNKYSIDDGNGMFYVDSGRTFFTNLVAQGNTVVFYDDFALFAYDVLTGVRTVVYSLPNRLETAAAYLAVQDLDGDGTTEIVADTSRFIAGKVPVTYPSVMRVWHFQNGNFNEIWHGTPRDLITRQSFPLSPSRDMKSLIVTHEETPGFPKIKHDFLCLYHWDGKELIQVAALDNTAAPVVDRGFVPVDLDGSGVQRIVAIEGSGIGNLHIAVIGLNGNKFTKIWESPPLRTAPRFGRVDDYDNTGKQEVPLFDEGKMFLFRQSGSKFIGWEGLKMPPAAPPPPPLGPDTRLDAIEYEANLPGAPFQTYIVLDGKKVEEVYYTPPGRSAFDKANEIRDLLVRLAKQKFPPAQVIARKVGDEDEEPKMEVTAGKTVIVTLTESEAKTAGKPLAAYAQEWVSVVKQILTTLAKPPQ